MAIKTGEKHLSEAELNSPDIDDDGNVDVEYFPLIEKIDSGNPYLDEIWGKAAKQLNCSRSDKLCEFDRAIFLAGQK